jgi:hypothetical protein
MAKLPDPIWDPKPVQKLYNPLAYMTIMDPQPHLKDEDWTPKKEVFPAEINLLDFNKNTSIMTALSAVVQHIESKFKRSTPAHYTPEGDAVRVNFEGKMGELVAAITTNRFLEPATGDYDFYADLDGDEVKTRGLNPKFMHMLVDKNKVKPDRRYWLIIGNYPVYRNMGWTTGKYILELGDWVELGPRGRSWGVHRDELNKWMPEFDRTFHIKVQLQQPGLPFEAPPPPNPLFNPKEIGPDTP